MKPQERNALLAEFSQGCDEIVAALHNYPKKMWEFKPEPDQWSIHQIVWHLADTEIVYYARCKKIIAEPGARVMAFHQDKWAEASHYHAHSVDDALAIIRILRIAQTRLLKGLPADAWTRTMVHPQVGKKNLQNWLAMSVNHVHTHIEQMQRVYEAWQSYQDEN